MGGLLNGLDRLGALSAAAVADLGPDQWRGVAERAVQVAAVTVTRAGADPPWAGELESD